MSANRLRWQRTAGSAGMCIALPAVTVHPVACRFRQRLDVVEQHQLAAGRADTSDTIDAAHQLGQSSMHDRSGSSRATMPRTVM